MYIYVVVGGKNRETILSSLHPLLCIEHCKTDKSIHRLPICMYVYIYIYICIYLCISNTF